MLRVARCSSAACLPAKARKLAPPPCAKKAGFGADASQQQAANVKVNERGKVSSRPGPPSQKELKKQQEYQRQQLLEQEQAQALTQAEGSLPAEEARRSGVASSSAPGEVERMPTPTRYAARAQQQVETPQVVVDRIFARILGFAGVPVFTGILLFPLFYYLKVVQKIDYPLWVVYVAQTLMFGGGLAGITYGALSASWDPTREGSFWGWTELKANLPILLNRGKQRQ